MNIHITKGELIIERVGYIYDIKNLRRSIQALNCDLKKKLISLKEHEMCMELIAMHI